ncbi:MAG: hypothetical protein H5T68_12600 [Chloroflexi bacterium]|nr:hypothetical protein [Chloroflexota bacterium]
MLQVRRAVLLTILALIVISLTVFAVLVLHYQPALSAAPGYEAIFVTKPHFWENPIRVWQRVTEQRPCEYQILGWSADNRLYYQATCGTETQVWEYALNRESSQTSLPNALIQNTLSRGNVLDMVRADGVRPREYEPVTRPVLLKSEGYLSPDGRMIAIVTQHLYGPQDIVILSSKN